MKKTPVKKIWLLAAVLGLAPTVGLAQTMDDLLNDGRNPDNVLTQSMGYKRHNYSPLNRSLRRMRTVVEDAGEAEVVEGGAAVERGLLQLQHKLQPPLLQKRMPLKQLVPHRRRE